MEAADGTTGHGGGRRRRLLLLAGLAVVVAAAVGVPVGLLSGGSSPPPAAPVAGARSALGTYVSRETASLERRYQAPAGNFCPGGVSQHSSPVADAGGLVALAVFCLPGDPRPVQVLAYRVGRWSVSAALAPPDWPPRAPNGVPLAGQPITTADLIGFDHPAFLVLLAAADNTPGFVVAQLHGRWSYAVFNGPYPTGNVVGRNPSFSGHHIVSEFNDCNPNCAAGRTTNVYWTFRPARGDFWAPDPPGWTPAPGAENYSGTSTTG